MPETAACTRVTEPSARPGPGLGGTYASGSGVGEQDRTSRCEVLGQNG